MTRNPQTQKAEPGTIDPRTMSERCRNDGARQQENRSTRLPDRHAPPAAALSLALSLSLLSFSPSPALSFSLDLSLSLCWEPRAVVDQDPGGVVRSERERESARAIEKKRARDSARESARERWGGRVRRREEEGGVARGGAARTCG